MTLIEPGGYATDWAGPSATRSAENPAYAQARQASQRRPTAVRRGDPAATGNAILTVVDAGKPPLRIFFGRAPLEIATADYESRLATWREWEPVSIAAQGN